MAVAAGLVVALVIAPDGGFSSLDLKVSLDTLGSASVCFAAVVAYARSRTLVSLSSRILVLALVLAATSMVVFVTVPALLGASPGPTLRFARTLLNLTAAALLAWAALTSPSPDGSRNWERRLKALILPERRLLARAVTVSIAAAGLGVAVAGIVASPSSVDVSYVAAAVVFVAAAAGLAVRAGSVSPTLAWWLALSSIFAAGTMLAVFINGAVDLKRISASDLMRAGSLLALGAGAMSELGAMRRRERAQAAGEERRRVASELHDGVAQELSYIAVQSQRLVALYPNAPGLDEIRAAAQLALEDCRTAIIGVSCSAAPTLGGAIESRARALASRAGLELTLDVADDIVTSGELEHEVVSIIREAISNTARHSGASRIEISLRTCRGTIVVRVSDNGRGFEPRATTPSQSGGLGLTSMRERARRLGGELVLDSRPGYGTTIELVIP